MKTHNARHYIALLLNFDKLFDTLLEAGETREEALTTGNIFTAACRTPLSMTEECWSGHSIIELIKLWKRLTEEGLIDPKWNVLAVYKCKSKTDWRAVNLSRVQFFHQLRSEGLSLIPPRPD